MYAREGMHCNMYNMNKNCNKSNGEKERTFVHKRVVNYREAQRSARNLLSCWAFIPRAAEARD